MTRTTLLVAALCLSPLPAVAQADLPPIIGELGLTNAEVRHVGRHGVDVLGTLPGGAPVEVDVDRSGGVEEVEARGPDGFPASAVSILVPEAVRANPAYPADASFESIEFDDDDGAIEIDGFRPDGTAFEAEFSASGEVIELKQD